MSQQPAPAPARTPRANISARHSAWVKLPFAAIAVFGLVLVNLIGPYQGLVSRSDAFEVIPLKPSDAIYQLYTAEGQAGATGVDTDTIELEVAPLPSPTPTPTPTPAAVSCATQARPAQPAGPPAAGTPDPGSAQAIAFTYVGPGEEFDCLVALWNRESHWNVFAYNAGSGAYGIPQALPGNKMASAGDDWETNPDTQIRWGLGYINGRYGSPCGAWAHSQSVGWY